MNPQSFVFLVLCVASSSSVSSSGKSNIIRIALEQGRHELPVNSLESFKIKVNSVKAIGASVNVSMQDFQDLYYYGWMTVGTPGQRIRVLYDTGSADLWVPSVQMCSSNPGYCDNHSNYTNTASSTYVQNGTSFSISYGLGDVSGYVSKDTISVEGLQVTEQLFAEVTQVDFLTMNKTYDGIFGLAYTALSVIGADPPFLSMINQNVVNQPLFAFYLNKQSESSSGAELVLGGVDPAHMTGNFTYTPVIEKKYWTIQFDRINVGNDIVVDSYSATPDSGTTFLIGPTLSMAAINVAIGAQLTDGYYLLNCSKLSSSPSVSFVINGVPFVLTPNDYVYKITDNNGTVYCLSTFFGSNVPSFVLGDVFMRKFYTVFDMGNNRIGFANAVSLAPVTNNLHMATIIIISLLQIYVVFIKQ